MIGYITEDEKPKHPLTYEQVWGDAPPYLDVRCPFCGQGVGQACVSATGWASTNPQDHVHATRIGASKQRMNNNG